VWRALQAPGVRSPVSVTLATDVPWLDFSTTSAATPAMSTLVLNPILLAQGMQSGVVTVTSSLGTVIVPVIVTVVNKGAFCDANGDGKTGFADVAAVQAHVGISIGQPGYDVHYDLNRDGVIDAQDVALAQTCVVAYGNPPLKTVYLPAVSH
jgi:Dockerin type I domain